MNNFKYYLKNFWEFSPFLFLQFRFVANFHANM